MYNKMKLEDFVKLMEIHLSEEVRQEYKVELFKQQKEQDEKVSVQPEQDEDNVVEPENPSIRSDVYQSLPAANKKSVIPDEHPRSWGDYICTFFRCGKGSKVNEEKRQSLGSKSADTNRKDGHQSFRAKR
jgi:hypothetical protein